MNVDNHFRRYRFVQADDTLDFHALVTGWLELAEELAPGMSKALLEGDYLAFLSDGSRFKEVTYKVEHDSVHEALPVWSTSSGRLVAHVEDEDFVISDGRRLRLADMRFERLE